ncbi:MAG: hypothetical protein ACRD5H_17795 [Nitrososphaerales archaeon]
MAAATKGKQVDSATKETRAMDTTFTALVDLQPDEQERVLAWLAQRLKITAPTVGTGGAGAAGTGAGTGAGAEAGMASAVKIAGTPGTNAHARSFMTQKKPGDQQERVACLAFYLTFHKDMSAFKTRDITQMNSDAGQANLSNAAMFLKNSVKVQYLSSAGKGMRQLTPRGEALVNALPDRAAVKQALADHPLSGRKKKGTGKKKSAKARS